SPAIATQDQGIQDSGTKSHRVRTLAQPQSRPPRGKARVVLTNGLPPATHQDGPEPARTLPPARAGGQSTRRNARGAPIPLLVLLRSLRQSRPDITPAEKQLIRARSVRSCIPPATSHSRADASGL